VAVGVVDHGRDLLPDEPHHHPQLEDDGQRQRQREVAEEQLLERGPAEGLGHRRFHDLGQHERRAEEGQEGVGAHEPLESADRIVEGGGEGV
jgi:hypothetical protein